MKPIRNSLFFATYVVAGLVSFTFFPFKNLSYEFHLPSAALLFFLTYVHYIKRPPATSAADALSHLIQMGFGLLLFLCTSFALAYFSGALCSFQNTLIYFSVTGLTSSMYAYLFSQWPQFARRPKLSVFLPLISLLLYTFYVFGQLALGPDVSFFHPLIGFWHGPIYDEHIPFPKKLVLFHGTHLSLAASYIFLLRRAVTERKFARAYLSYMLTAFFLLYGGHHFLHFQGSYASIKEKLSATIASETLELRFHPSTFGPAEAWLTFRKARFYQQHIQDTFHMATSPSTKIFVYPSPEIKKSLSGAKDTFIGHPIQRTMHILPIDVDSPIFRHELTHLSLYPWGVWGISTRAFFLEGVATSIEGFRNGLSLSQWAKVIADDFPHISIDQLSRNSFFWSQPSLHSYLYSGAFLQWYRHQYGITPIRKNYFWGNVQDTSFFNGQVQDDWAHHLAQQKLSPKQLTFAKSILQQKSLFQKKCPHEVADQLKKAHHCKPHEDRSHFLKRAVAQSNNTSALPMWKLIQFYFERRAWSEFDRAVTQYKKLAGSNVWASTWAMMYEFDAHIYRNQTQQALALLSQIDDTALSDILSLHYDIRDKWFQFSSTYPNLSYADYSDDTFTYGHLTENNWPLARKVLLLNSLVEQKQHEKARALSDNINMDCASESTTDLFRIYLKNKIFLHHLQREDQLTARLLEKVKSCDLSQAHQYQLDLERAFLKNTHSR